MRFHSLTKSHTHTACDATQRVSDMIKIRLNESVTVVDPPLPLAFGQQTEQGSHPQESCWGGSRIDSACSSVRAANVRACVSACSSRTCVCVSVRERVSVILRHPS